MMTASKQSISLANQVSLALGGQDYFAELLACLPDSFFALEHSEQDAVWGRILASVTHGRKDPEKLALLVHAQARA